MFGDIIVPLDGSDRSKLAIGPASAIARFLDTSVRLVAFTARGDESRMQAWVAATARRIGVVKREIRVETRIESVGEHLESLLRSAPSDLVCMTTHGRGRSAGVMGSVASDVLRRASGPVLLLGPNYEEHRFHCRGNLLASVDGSPHSEAIVPIVEAFGIALGFDVMFTTVIDSRGAKALQLAEPGAGSVAMESNYIHRIAEQAKDEIGRPVEFEVLHGSRPAEAILAHADSVDATLIAMATHGSTGLRRVLTGSVTADVIRGARCPVLAVRPPTLQA